MNEQSPELNSEIGSFSFTFWLQYTVDESPRERTQLIGRFERITTFVLTVQSTGNLCKSKTFTLKNEANKIIHNDLTDQIRIKLNNW